MTDREAYIEQTKLKLKEWTECIEDLRQRAERSDAQSGRETQARIEDLKERCADAEEHLRQLEDAEDDVWSDMATAYEEDLARHHRAMTDSRAD